MLHDLLTSFRRAVRTPLFSLTLVAILGAGIGMATAMVSVLDALSWRPVAMPQPYQLADITTVLPDDSPRGVPLPVADRVTRASLPVDGWCAYTYKKFTTRVAGRMMEAGGALMSAGCKDVTRVAPVMGRWFTAAEAPVSGRGQPVAIISDRYWALMFNRAPDVLGRTIRLDDGREDGAVTVIGVLPASFTGFHKDYADDIIKPFAVFQPLTVTWDLIGRLRPGSSLEALRAQVTAQWPAIIRDAAPLTSDPADAARLQGRVQSVAPGFSILRGLYAPTLGAVTLLAVLLLVLTCINASGLLAAKVASHREEILVMRALGATGWRIARQLLAEAFIVAVAACGLGVVIADVATRAFPALLPWGQPWTISFTPDIRILVGVAGGSLVVTLLIAAVPAWLASRVEQVVKSNRTVTRRASRWSDAMLMGQLAATVVLVFACGLLVRSFTSLGRVDRGFDADPEHLLSVRLEPGPGGYEGLNQAEYYPRLIRQFAALPGVESVGSAMWFSTINDHLYPRPIALASRDAVHTAGSLEWVSPNFFATIGVPILRGRDVAWTDRPDTPKVAVVSESLAHDLDPREDVVGRSIDFGEENIDRQHLQIIGVVGNISVGNYKENDVKLVFVPAVQANQATHPTFQIRTSGDPLALVQPVTRIVNAAGHEYVERAVRVDDMFSNSLIAERMAATISTAAAMLGVVLAALGLYALLMHSVTIRTREIGIRMAVGAGPRSISGLIVRHMLALILGGVVVGVPAALAGSVVLRSVLYGVTTTDGVSLAAAVGMLAVVGAAAAMLPAARAGRVDPVQLLRAE